MVDGGIYPKARKLKWVYLWLTYKDYWASTFRSRCHRSTNA